MSREVHQPSTSSGASWRRVHFSIPCLVMLREFAPSATRLSPQRRGRYINTKAT